MSEAITTPHSTRLDVLRVAMTGGFATLNLFLLGWAWAALTLPGADAFLGLFTIQPVGSVAALLIGGLCALLVGGVFGALIAHCYNLAGWALGS